ncbi:telomere repeat-binding factor 1 isoform X2 [Nymphaea colorata]|uniref:telomere repeat-binding factor 1 isoform X2 n=1 Tax=Nymphaea colorata TaxID=210225 RepID=UPI00129E64FA|nr:telomere repeat-binding factor 1 isoform X2 [Nymphaea colorata]XP_031490155.1 telomere repeat-binding factor 1 isoform X2 [Nymphaea colorata]
MGAPKQKWTSEEESALRAGVVKHGAGKWRTILKDPEFNVILALRSNVDLKDKWRNMSVTANGWGSREKARLALRRSQQLVNHDDNPIAVGSSVTNLDEEIVDTKPLAVSSGVLQIAGSKRPLSRLDSIIIEAITNLKEPGGSNKSAIALYIKDQYSAPPSLKRLLSAKLKALTANRRLIKVKRRYRIAPNLSITEERNSGSLLLEGSRHKDSSRSERDDLRFLTKSHVDAELAKMRNMNALEAARAAAQAVAEAEAAMAEAEEAAREAEAAEADAEAAQAFAEAAVIALKGRNASKLGSLVHVGMLSSYCMPQQAIGSANDMIRWCKTIQKACITSGKVFTEGV